MRRSSGRRMALRCRPPSACRHRGWSRHAPVAAQEPEFADQNDGARAFKLRLRRSRLGKPRQRFPLDCVQTATCSAPPNRGGLSSIHARGTHVPGRAAPTASKATYSVTAPTLAALPPRGQQRLFRASARDRPPREPFPGPTRPIRGRPRMKRRRQGRSTRLCIDTSSCAARLCSRPLRR